MSREREQSSKLLSFFSHFSKKEKKGKPPQLKEVSAKRAGCLVYGGLCFFVLIGVFGCLRAIGLSAQVNSLKNKVVAMDKTVNQVSSTASSLDISKVQYYMSNFIYAYINYDQETADDRQKTLDGYYAFDNGADLENLSNTRTLKTQRVVSIEQKGSYSLALVKISYEEAGTSYVMTLAVPFTLSKGKLSIVSPPYSLADNTYQGKGDALEQVNSNDVILLTSNDISSIKNFLSVFFDKYASSDETDLKLLMKEPVLMGGSYQVDIIDVNSAVFYQGKDNQKVVQVPVTFTDTNTQDKHTENFTLYLIKTDKGWYVERLENIFKNDKEEK